MVEFTKNSFPDSRCFIVYDQVYLRHRTGNHPEHPRRLIYSKKALEECDFAFRLDWMKPKKAGESEVRWIHTQNYIDLVRTACEKAGDGYIRLDLDTVVCKDSFEVALYAVGGLECAIDLALGTGWASSFALVRPPGHHAIADHSMGFCLFNNVAIGAKYAIERNHLKRIMIIDWDLHHGNGTQYQFYDDPKVFYISLHQAHHYPGTGFPEEIGEGEGLGYNLNFPLPAGTGDSEYSYIFTQVVGPLAMAFKPELILVSAGYDAHCDDPLGLLRVTEGEYGRMAYYLRCVANEIGTRIVFTLEGGYDLDALGASVVETLRPMVLEKKDDAYLPRPFKIPDDVRQLVHEQKDRMSKFWNFGRDS